MDSVFVDRGYFADVGCAASASKEFERFNRLGTKVMVSVASLLIHELWYDMQVGEHGPLHEILYAEDRRSELNIGDLTEVSRLLDRCDRYQGSNDGSFVIDSASAPSQSDTYPAAFGIDKRALVGIAVSVSHLAGPGEISHLREVGTRRVFLFAGEESIIEGFRHHIIGQLCSKACLHRYSKEAFPLLQLHPALDPENLNVDLNNYASTVVSHLSFLNDKYLDLGDQHAWDLPQMQATARAHGVDFSDESTSTKKNKLSMRARDVTLDFAGKSKTVSCSLHTKVQPTKGRIHFSVEGSSVARIVFIGIMHEHLST